MHRVEEISMRWERKLERMEHVLLNKDYAGMMYLLSISLR